MIKRRRILITGRVQGVGFRPAVYRLANRFGLSGFVYNDTRGVTVEVQGEGEKVEEFCAELRSGEGGASMAEIKGWESSEADLVDGEAGFVIGESEGGGAAVSEVTADIATCGDCLAEMRDSGDFRYRYPFINCTNCGPRYSIVKTVPYDRCNTTMGVFAMCGRCAGQYGDVGDRRFHAQPVACAGCGPKVRLTDCKGAVLEGESDAAIAEAARMLQGGKIVAIKGVGGFHLAVDALNDSAVRRLRERKRRDHKPFAMMAGSVEKIREYALVDEAAERVLRSAASPIVLLAKREGAAIAGSVAEGVGTFGFMLCYAPLHYLLFEEGVEVLVMTSGNLSDEPLICRDEEALARLGGVADAFLLHDREIYRQVDDSVVHFIDGEAVLLRRARGYVPEPIFGGEQCGEEILATGADMKNAFCLVKGRQFILSEHIGDLEDAAVYHHYAGSVEHLRGLFESEPRVVVCDMHPGYLSTGYALSMGEAEVLQVQHHWAHIASVLAEHGVGGPVIGIECDGTGYGTDGAIWGCELMIATLEDFERIGHLSYYQLAGGDAASKEAIRPVVGLLRKAYGEDFELKEFGWLLERIEADAGKREIIAEQIEKKVNCVETSSLGRVFDAAAAMAGVGSYNYFDAQLPMGLESIAAGGVEGRYDFEIIKGDEGVELDLGRMIRQLVSDVKDGTAAGVISAKFHNTIAAGLLEMARVGRERRGLEVVALSGGVFCNRYLSNRLIKLLKKDGFVVLFNQDVPSNDGGVALGQAAIAVCLVLKGRGSEGEILGQRGD